MNFDNITKEQKHKLYCDTLELLQGAGVLNGICYYLSVAIRLNKMQDYFVRPNEFEINFKQLPELMNQKPRFCDTAFWFPTDEQGKLKRIEILKKCIEQTK